MNFRLLVSRSVSHIDDIPVVPKNIPNCLHAIIIAVSSSLACHRTNAISKVAQGIRYPNFIRYPMSTSSQCFMHLRAQPSAQLSYQPSLSYPGQFGLCLANCT